jgi:hypothetical protein
MSNRLHFCDQQGQEEFYGVVSSYHEERQGLVTETTAGHTVRVLSREVEHIRAEADGTQGQE